MEKKIKHILTIALGMLLLVVSACSDDVDPQEHGPIKLWVVYAIPTADQATTTGTVPIDNETTYHLGDEITVLPNTGGLTKTGAVFGGWSPPWSTTTVYQAGDNINTSRSPASTFTLTLRWAYKVTYNGNGSDGGAVPVDDNNYVPTVAVTVASPGTLTRTGYTFAGWNTNAAGTGTNRAAGSTFAMGSAGVTLYAKWTAI